MSFLVVFSSLWAITILWPLPSFSRATFCCKSVSRFFRWSKQASCPPGWPVTAPPPVLSALSNMLRDTAAVSGSVFTSRETTAHNALHHPFCFYKATKRKTQGHSHPTTNIQFINDNMSEIYVALEVYWTTRAREISVTCGWSKVAGIIIDYCI